MNEMVIVAGTVRIDPEKLAEARPVMEKVIRLSRAEDGCEAYSYAVDMLDPSLVHVFEVWRDKAALEAHFKIPHLAEWRAAWPALGVTDRKLWLYENAKRSAL